jgi:EAL domain-containing protein (putative c-di-GMP-specific phosphodiesterase class I)
MIIPIGEWALRQACADAMSWPEEIHVAVNLSAGQFKGNQPIAAVERALAASGLPASRLELEITEAALAENADQTIRILHDLRARGVRIVMDDFGTGNSSLNHLRSFPFERIKIDGSFVRDITSNNGAAAIVRAVAGLGKGLKLNITAEGVETVEQMAVLRACDCDAMQGFLFSRPVPMSETGALLRREGQIPRAPLQPENVQVEEDVLLRFPWKNPQLSSPAGGRLPVEVTGNGDVLHGESV